MIDEQGPADHAPAHVDPAATYDALWRKQPQVLGFIQWARAIPGYAARFSKTVPDEFVAKVAVDAVDIACPCGETPRCRWNIPTACGCGRVFAYFGSTVHVQPLDHS